MNAFYFCGMEKLELPDTLETIDVKTFFKCTQLKEVKIPVSVRSIERGAFHGCNRLKILEFRHDPDFIGEELINKSTRIRCYQGSKVDAYCQEHDYITEYIE
jgi:hypothetical protein